MGLCGGPCAGLFSGTSWKAAEPKAHCPSRAVGRGLNIFTQNDQFPFSGKKLETIDQNEEFQQHFLFRFCRKKHFARNSVGNWGPRLCVSSPGAARIPRPCLGDALLCQRTAGIAHVLRPPPAGWSGCCASRRREGPRPGVGKRPADFRGAGSPQLPLASLVVPAGRPCSETVRGAVVPLPCGAGSPPRLHCPVAVRGRVSSPVTLSRCSAGAGSPPRLHCPVAVRGQVLLHGYTVPLPCGGRVSSTVTLSRCRAGQVLLHGYTVPLPCGAGSPPRLRCPVAVRGRVSSPVTLSRCRAGQGLLPGYAVPLLSGGRLSSPVTLSRCRAGQGLLPGYAVPLPCGAGSPPRLRCPVAERGQALLPGYAVPLPSGGRFSSPVTLSRC
ncbi:uncharacterized protein LOC142819930 [Pelodiscus sinensis]|uniref:uncharacterized protein LOC142819930 n=1 Tax=Pelodiscus sinensis TaxID=13735 RepID=UPI003F6CAE37